MKEEKKEVHAGGRPKEKFEPWDNWQHDIIELYKEGASDVEIRGLLIEKLENRSSLSYDLWDRWLKEEAQFSETIKMGRVLSQVWWERTGREGIVCDSMQETDKVNYTGWYINMKNRFGWKDKQEIQTTEVKTIKVKRAVKK